MLLDSNHYPFQVYNFVEYDEYKVHCMRSTKAQLASELNDRVHTPIHTL